MEKYKEAYTAWLEAPGIDEETKAELRAIEGDEKEIEDRFYCDLEFGTAGLRGIIGAGTNRMNKYVVRRATQGLSNYILKNAEPGRELSVAIAYDSRHFSKEFSDEAARTFAANGIRAYRFEDLRPTPELSFTIRQLHCIAGINVTASHNPSNYNGYKVYWEDGAQITPPHDSGIMAEVLAIEDLMTCKTMSREDAEKAGLYVTIGKEVDDAFIGCVEDTIVDKEMIRRMAEDITIVYTPLNGAGYNSVMRVMNDLGFKKVYTVPEQSVPDGDFPTCPYPNPEMPETFTLALKLAKEKDADIVLATDPDSDRLGMYVKNEADGEYVLFNGNMTASLLCEYILGSRKYRGTLPADGCVMKTIVSTDLMRAVASYWGCETIECLTGFKWMGREILRQEKEGNIRYQFGMEESYGCLIGTYARDKDAVSAVASLCEAAAYYKSQGKTLIDAMTDMYIKYGYYREHTKSVAFPGKEGKELMAALMEKLRAQTPTEIGGFKVLQKKDYQKDEVLDMATGKVTPTGLPKSNVLLYKLEDDAWICVRPSGTEPKVKFYFGIKGADPADAEEMVQNFVAFIDAWVG